MQRNLVGVFICLLVFPYVARPAERRGPTVPSEELTRSIPARSGQHLTGSEFVKYVSKMNPQEREQAIRDEILKGNLPEFLRKLVPVELHYDLPSTKSLTATIFVAPDYLAIGSDSDFLRIPMSLHTAALIAERFGFILPTKKMVDAIYLQSRYHFVPQPLPAGPQMRSTAYYWTHNQMVEDQAHGLGVRLGELVSGDKKDVVMTNRLAVKVGRIAIYGWHRGPGQPIQPLSTIHGANYADYSHGIRLISELALIDGKLRSVYDILRDPLLAKILSDEGPIPRSWESLSPHQDSPTIATTSSD
ncbi:MAG TPA: hypothetical protein VMH03_21340 [Terriglobales bacterium]|nr:hypothetical protein [Terriglobales bacterium]